MVMQDGIPGDTYNIGGSCERQNIEIVEMVCKILDDLCPKQDGTSYKAQIKFVKDRPGHDRRYAIDASKIKQELGWKPNETFNSGMRKTVEWYLNNQVWVENILNGKYRCERLGLGGI